MDTYFQVGAAGWIPSRHMTLGEALAQLKTLAASYGRHDPNVEERDCVTGRLVRTHEIVWEPIPNERLGAAGLEVPQ